MSPDQPFWGRGWTAAAIVAGVLFLLIAGCTALVTSADDNEPDGSAMMACKDAVRAQLKSPATADFPFAGSSTVPVEDGGWEISGELTAENMFGGRRTLTYTCEIGEDGETVTNTVVVEK